MATDELWVVSPAPILMLYPLASSSPAVETKITVAQALKLLAFPEEDVRSSNLRLTAGNIWPYTRPVVAEAAGS